MTFFAINSTDISTSSTDYTTTTSGGLCNEVVSELTIVLRICRLTPFSTIKVTSTFFRRRKFTTDSCNNTLWQDPADVPAQPAPHPSYTHPVAHVAELAETRQLL